MLKNRILRINVSLVLIVVFVLSPYEIAKADTWYYDYPVEAYDYYPNSQAYSYPYITADTAHRVGREISKVRLSWEIKPGDTIQMIFWDKNASQMPIVNVNSSLLSARKFEINAPKGACTGQIQLTTGTAEGARQVWIKEFDTTYYGTYFGTAVFADPEIMEDPEDPPDPPDPPPQEDPPPYDPGEELSGPDLVDELRQIKGAINGMSSGVITELQGLRNHLTSLTSDINEQFDEVKNRLDTISEDVSAIRSDVADIKDDVSVIKSDVATMKDYFTTPRSPSPLQVNTLPQPAMNSTIPDLTEPYQNPYTYDRAEPTYPPAAFGPEPLPLAPDPHVMPHDEPLIAETPKQLDPPVTREDPRPTDPVIKEDPRQMDPVNMDPPRGKDEPIARKNPFGKETPITPENPLTPQPPINRTTPLTPQPPRTPGGG